jgi:hypothetical protein
MHNIHYGNVESTNAKHVTYNLTILLHRHVYKHELKKIQNVHSQSQYQFHIPSDSGSLDTVTKRKSKFRFHSRVMLFSVYSYKKKLCLFFEHVSY